MSFEIFLSLSVSLTDPKCLKLHTVGGRREERPRRRRLLSSLSGPREVLPLFLLFLRQNYADGFCTPLAPPASFAKIAAGGGLKETISSGMEFGMPACKMEMRGDGAKERRKDGQRGRRLHPGGRRDGRFKWAIS